MKKAYIIAAAIASLAVLVSCNKEEIAAPQNDQTQYGPMSITINYDDVDTKTAFTQNGSTLEEVWKDGDAVSVLIKENGTNEKFVLTSGAGTKSATFTCASSYLSTITEDTWVRIIYPYTNKENAINTYWASDISNQGNGSIDNLGNYDIRYGNNVKVTYVAGGQNTFEAKYLTPLCWVLRLPAGLQLLSNAPATDVITNLTISGTTIQNVRLDQKNGTAAVHEAGAISLSNIFLTNGCLANDVYVAVMTSSSTETTINISFTLQSNGITYTYPYTRTGSSFYTGHSYKMSQTALNSTRPLIKYVPGALGGVFSVSADKTVMFAKGNLQAVYDPMNSTCTWRFAEHQYDKIGNEAGNTTIENFMEGGVVVDLFGWTKSGLYNDGIKQYGINTSTTESDYGSSTEETLEDWGKAYAASNGCSAGTWFTLSKDEWKYLINTRTNATNLYKIPVTVAGYVNCLVLAPDGFSGTIATSYTADEWAAAEANGLVCLPTGGHLDRLAESAGGGYAIMYASTRGYYWSSTPYATASNSACCLNFVTDSYGSRGDASTHFARYSRQSVRICTLYN